MVGHDDEPFGWRRHFPYDFNGGNAHQTKSVQQPTSQHGLMEALGNDVPQKQTSQEAYEERDDNQGCVTRGMEEQEHGGAE